jgi:hypothetical protein
MFTKTEATSLAAVPGTVAAICSLKLMVHPLLPFQGELAICSLKLMLHPQLLFQVQRLLHGH